MHPRDSASKTSSSQQTSNNEKLYKAILQQIFQEFEFSPSIYQFIESQVFPSNPHTDQGIILLRRDLIKLLHLIQQIFSKRAKNEQEDISLFEKATHLITTLQSTLNLFHEAEILDKSSTTPSSVDMAAKLQKSYAMLLTCSLIVLASIKWAYYNAAKATDKAVAQQVQSVRAQLLQLYAAERKRLEQYSTNYNKYVDMLRGVVARLSEDAQSERKTPESVSRGPMPIQAKSFSHRLADYFRDKFFNMIGFTILRYCIYAGAHFGPVVATNIYSKVKPGDASNQKSASKKNKAPPVDLLKMFLAGNSNTMQSKVVSGLLDTLMKGQSHDSSSSEETMVRFSGFVAGCLIGATLSTLPLFLANITNESLKEGLEDAVMQGRDSAANSKDAQRLKFIQRLRTFFQDLLHSFMNHLKQNAQAGSSSAFAQQSKWLMFGTAVGISFNYSTRYLITTVMWKLVNVLKNSKNSPLAGSFLPSSMIVGALQPFLETISNNILFSFGDPSWVWLNSILAWFFVRRWGKTGPQQKQQDARTTSSPSKKHDSSSTVDSLFHAIQEQLNGTSHKMLHALTSYVLSTSSKPADAKLSSKL